MANNYYICKWSSNIGHDAENPSFSVDNTSSATSNNNIFANNARHDPRPASKAVKQGLFVLMVSVAVILVVALGRNGSSNNYGASTAPESSIARQPPLSESYEEINSPGTHGKTPMTETAVESKHDALKSITSEYYISNGPLQARVKMGSPSILNGYETCSDLERDVVEALKIYMNDFILNEAVSNEEYATCDPANDNWHAFSDGYYYYDNNYDYGELHFLVT